MRCLDGSGDVCGGGIDGGGGGSGVGEGKDDVGDGGGRGVGDGEVFVVAGVLVCVGETNGQGE